MTDVAEEFNAYVAARKHVLVRTAYLLTGDRHDAEDLVQATLTRTFLAWHRIRERNAVDAYVRRTMVNEHTSWWRRAWRRTERSTADLPERPADSPIDLADRDEVWDLVRTLPPRQRAIVVLRFYEDLSPAEIAATLGCSVGTVASQTSRAIAALRARYAELGEPSSRVTAEEGAA
ncbi:SigE family RNA polymerase sigma factor [Actinopolymorpha alba]|uniref:SigE family RNA polymerase sigma factor n=1 Tax=Actinopolymorpha alba TaxID=533267 RepID=UPI00035FE091|nr:SigE family RNA polymerase sigma factor [Actinopolymorpha alba]